MPSHKKILVVNLAGMGDVVLSSPAIKSLAQQFPTSDLYLLTYWGNAPTLARCPYFKEVFFLDKKMTRRTLAALFALRKLKLDAAANIYNIHSVMGMIKMFLLFSFLGAKKTFGRNTNGKGFFYNYKIRETSDFKKHDVDAMLDTVSLLGAGQRPQGLELWIDEDEAGLENFLENNSIKEDDDIICLHPGASRASHRWMPEGFASFADKLVGRYSVKIVITGAKDERNLARQISKDMSHKSVIAAGELSLNAFAALLRRSKLLVTNDTGPMHIANALGIPLVIIAGNSPRAFWPFNKENTVVLEKKINDHAPLNDIASLHSICVDEVWDAAQPLLGKLEGKSEKKEPLKYCEAK